MLRKKKPIDKFIFFWQAEIHPSIHSIKYSVHYTEQRKAAIYIAVAKYIFVSLHYSIYVIISAPGLFFWYLK